MAAFEGSLEGEHGEWSVGDRVGSSARWRTYRGTGEGGAPVAIRTLVGEVPDDRLDRFDSLARQWAAVDERRTVRTLRDWGTDPEPWVAVEYVPDELAAWATGNTLAAAVACDRRTRGELLSDVCETLRTYARYGSTPSHLTIHPDCLSFRMDSEGPVPVVGDWGLSGLVVDPPVTPFTAPEQLDDDHAGRRTDVYRVGVLAAAVLSGTVPFSSERIAAGDGSDGTGATDRPDRNTLASAIRDGLDVDALGDSLPDDAIRPVRRATDRDPEARYATTYPLGRDLLDATPLVDVGDREAGALAPTVAPSAPVAADGTTDEAADTTNDDPNAEREADEESGNDTGDARNDTGDAGSETSDGSDDSKQGAGDAGGSRRSVLAYGAAAIGGIGLAYGGFRAFDDGLGTSEPSTGALASDDNEGPDAETHEEDGDPSLEVTGGTVSVGVQLGGTYEGLPEATADAGLPESIDVVIDDRFEAQDRVDQYIAAVESGHAPDLFVVDSGELGRLVRAGVTEPLSRHADGHSIGDVLGESFPALETRSRHPETGAVHAVPYAFAPETIVYRKDAFSGVADESTFEAWMTDPPTWSEWSSTVATLRRDQGFVWSGQQFQIPRIFSEVLASFGGGYYEVDPGPAADTDPVTVADDRGIEAANVLHDLVIGGDTADADIERASSEQVFDYGFIEPQRVFENRDAIAVRVPLSFFIGRVPESERGGLGVMPTPAGTAGSYTSVYGQYLVVNPNTDVLAEALSVAETFRSPAVAPLIVERGFVPTLNGDPFSVEAVANAPSAEYRPAIEYITEHAVLEPSTSAWTESRETVGALLQDAIAGDQVSALEELEAFLRDGE